MLPDVPCNSGVKLQVDEDMVEFSPAPLVVQVCTRIFYATLGSHGNSSVTMVPSRNLAISTVRETSSLPSGTSFHM